VGKEEPTETPSTASSPENSKPISKEEKQKIIGYLNDLVFDAFYAFREGRFVPKLSKNVKTAQTNILKEPEKFDYAQRIENADNREKVERIRAQIVDDVYCYV